MTRPPRRRTRNTAPSAAPPAPVIHERFSLASWRRKFSSDDIEEATGARHTTSPIHVVAMESLRQRARVATTATGKTRGTDVAVWATGEPPHPAATKLGGVPFLPPRARWPRGGGEPLPFVGQLCFANSRSLLKAPADVMLVFATPYGLVEGEGPEVALRWVDLDEGSPFPKDRVPETDFEPIAPCFATLYRGIEYADEAIDRRLATFNATKLGGLPHAIQELPPALHSRRAKFLGAFGAVQPAFGVPHPWVNVAEPASFGAVFEQNGWFMVGDMGGVNFFLIDGDITIDAACH